MNISKKLLAYISIVTVTSIQITQTMKRTHNNISSTSTNYSIKDLIKKNKIKKEQEKLYLGKEAHRMFGKNDPDEFGTINITSLIGISILINLTEIIINHCDLEDLGTKNFVSLCHVHTLFLSHNKIRELKAQTFTGLVKVFNLSLDDNEIENIEDEALEPLIALKELYLRDNKLTKIGKIFTKNTLLYNLLLSRNKIEFIHPNAFVYNKELSNLFLTNNNLLVLNCALPRFMFTLDLAENPLCAIEVEKNRIRKQLCDSTSVNF